MNNGIRDYFNNLSNAFNELKSCGVSVGVFVVAAFVLEKLFYLACCTITLNLIFKVFNKIIDMF